MDLQDDIPKALEEELQRVKALQSLKLLDLLNQILCVKNQKEALDAGAILAEKEITAEEDEEWLEDQDTTDLVTELNHLHRAHVNHKLVQTLLQKICFNSQTQDSVASSLREVDAEKTIDKFPEKGHLLSNYSQNLDTCKDLLKVVKEKEQLDQEILDLRLQYSGLLKDVKEMWETVDKKDDAVSDSAYAEEITKAEASLRQRESKLQFMITLLQAFITSSGFMWGEDPYYLEVLLLCDSVFSCVSPEEQDRLIERTKLLREGQTADSEPAPAPAPRTTEPHVTSHQPTITQVLEEKRRKEEQAAATPGAGGEGEELDVQARLKRMRDKPSIKAAKEKLMRELNQTPK